MSIADWFRAASRWLGEWADAVEHDPVLELHQRVSRLECIVGMDSDPHQHTKPELTPPDAPGS